MSEELDWEYLSTELERVASYFVEGLGKGRQTAGDRLHGRKWILKQLDDLAGFIH